MKSNNEPVINVVSFIASINVGFNFGGGKTTWNIQLWPFFWRFGRTFQDMDGNGSVDVLYLGPVGLITSSWK